MELTATLEKFDNNIWGYHFPIPKEIAVKFIEGKDRRIKCTINGLSTIHCALMPYPEGFFILMNKTNVKKFRLRIGDEVNLNIEKDNSEYGMPVPESFQTLLDQDEEGSCYFHQLTPGKQRSLIYLVSKVKNIDSQLNKGLAILEHLTETKGKLNGKVLMEKIKLYNQRSKLND